VADVQRACGICGNELDLHLLAAAQGASAERFALREDFVYQLLLERRAEKQIDEARAGHNRFLDIGRGWQCGHYGLGDLARRTLEHAREL
jgi:hypothetical protein